MQEKQTAFTVRVPASLIEAIESDAAYSGLSRNSIANKALQSLRVELDGPTRKQALVEGQEAISGALAYLIEAVERIDARARRTENKVDLLCVREIKGIVNLTDEDFDAFHANMERIRALGGSDLE